MVVLREAAVAHYLVVGNSTGAGQFRMAFCPISMGWQAGYSRLGPQLGQLVLAPMVPRFSG